MGWAKEVTRDISDRTPSDLTDEELLEAILTSGARLMDRARQRNAEMGSLTGDPRWKAPHLEGVLLPFCYPRARAIWTR
jgi:hypothetical protein